MCEPMRKKPRAVKLCYDSEPALYDINPKPKARQEQNSQVSGANKNQKSKSEVACWTQ